MRVDAAAIDAVAAVAVAAVAVAAAVRPYFLAKIKVRMMMYIHT